MRVTLLGLGVCVLALAWFGAPGVPPAYVFSAHMLRHMAVVAVAAPLLAAAAAHGPLDPARAAPWLFAAIPAAMLELVVVWGWHMPVLHQAARASTGTLVLEQLAFLGAGLFLWISALGGPAGQRHARRAAGVVGLLLTAMHMTLLGALFALAPRPLYQHPGHSVNALAALEDQHLGGAIMLLVGGASYAAGGVWLVAGMLRGRPAEVQGA